MVFLAILVGAAGSAVLWMSFLAPSIAHLFGAPLAFGFWRLDRKNSHLSKTQFLWWFGVFTFGVGIFLYGAVFDLLRLTLLHEHLSFSRSSVGGFVIAILGGLLVGLTSAPKGKPIEKG